MLEYVVLGTVNEFIHVSNTTARCVMHRHWRKVSEQQRRAWLFYAIARSCIISIVKIWIWSFADNKLIFIHCVIAFVRLRFHRHGPFRRRTIRISIEYLRKRLPPTVRYSMSICEIARLLFLYWCWATLMWRQRWKQTTYVH